MRDVNYSTVFRRELKKAHKQGKDTARLHAIIEMLRTGVPLPIRYFDHPLKGSWQGSRELHIEPDWLLIYHIDENTLYLERMGSHTDLFD